MKTPTHDVTHPEMELANSDRRCEAPKGGTINAIEPREPNLFVVLADQARSRSGWELLATSSGGAVDAAFIFQRLGMWWISAAFIAIAAYGAWGLLDRGMEWLQLGDDGGAASARWPQVLRLLDVGRGLATALGALSLIAAVGGFMAAALANWQH